MVQFGLKAEKGIVGKKRSNFPDQQGRELTLGTGEMRTQCGPRGEGGLLWGLVARIEPGR